MLLLLRVHGNQHLRRLPCLCAPGWRSVLSGYSGQGTGGLCRWPCGRRRQPAGEICDKRRRLRKDPRRLPENAAILDLWKDYSSRCISCGRCNFVCPTCTCFTMQDLFYTDNGKVGERRRVWASCMVDGYTDVAGGGSYRKTNGERMRFKVMHKALDFKQRAGYQMCVAADAAMTSVRSTSPSPTA